MTINEEKKQNPPYLSYKTFEHFLSRLHEPLYTCFDNNYWGKTYSGDTGMQLDTAMRFLNLIDNDDRPTPRLRILIVATGEHRAALLRQIVYESYPLIFKWLWDNGTANYAELEDIFQHTYGLEAFNCSKCVKFFVNLAKDAGISIIKMKRIARYTGRQA